MNAHNIELRYNTAFTPPRQNDSIIMFKVCLHGVSKEELVCFNNVIFFIGTLICLTLQQVMAWASQMRHGWENNLLGERTHGRDMALQQVGIGRLCGRY